MNYIINRNETILDALKRMDRNHQGFLIVVETQNDFLYGTLTDGDIRRALILGKSLQEEVGNICNNNCHSISQKADFTTVIEHFKNKAISFLPVVDENGRVVNLLTKKQLHTLLLTDKRICLTDDFSDVDETLMDYEVFPKPWGFYKTVVMNEYFQLKVISIHPGEGLSLQMHNKREEYWIVAHGHGTVQIEKSKLDVQRGTTLFIPKGCKHRIMNTDKNANLIVTEIQIGDYFGEDDIIRFDDMYGRS